MKSFNASVGWVLLICCALATTGANAAGNSCSFGTKGLSMSFGTLNPASGSNVVVPVSGLGTAGDCAPG